MDTHLGSAPFGSRAMSLSMLAYQHKADKIEPGLVRDKWKLFRAVCEARPRLGVTDRALTVLDALLTFYPDTELSEKRGLVVFPSNIQLSLRSRGMTPATLRRHLAVLVDAGLIVRKDSPNGKRYARRNGAGELSQAFGFSLAPLLARACEIETLAQEIITEREHLRLCRESLTLCRRDITKLIETFANGIDDTGLDLTCARFRALVVNIPRRATVTEIEAIIEDMTAIKEDILNTLKKQIKSSDMSGNESQTERHIRDSDTDSSTECEYAGARQAGAMQTLSKTKKQTTTCPLDMVIRACPEISLYSPKGQIKNWRDLLTASSVVRRMLGISDGAYQHATDIMGQENTATVIACVLERAGHIKSAGGYIRDLTARATRDEFSPAPMVMALLGRDSKTIHSRTPAGMPAYG